MRSPVDYSQIQSDYQYFLEHSSESAAQLSALARRLRRLAETEPSIRLLDFGCGDGQFCKRLLQESQLPAGRFDLSLVEPNTELRELAQLRLHNWLRTDHSVAAKLAELPQLEFHGVLANHSLYYVEDLPTTVTQLLAALRPGGYLVAALLDQQNTVARLWRAALRGLVEPFPFHFAEDLAAITDRLGARVRAEPIHYQVRFPDKRDNRTRVMRFLSGPYWQRADQARLIRLFDSLKRGNVIDFETSYPQLIIQPGDSAQNHNPKP